MIETPGSGDHFHTDSHRNPQCCPAIGHSCRWCWGFLLSVEIFRALSVSNSAIAMRDRAARTQGVPGVRHTRDFRPVFWPHRDPLTTRLRLSEALCVRVTRCLRLTRRSRRRTVTPVSTGRPSMVCKQLQLFAKNCNQINNLDHFWIFWGFWGPDRGRGWGRLFISLRTSGAVSQLLSDCFMKATQCVFAFLPLRCPYNGFSGVKAKTSRRGISTSFHLKINVP